MNLHTFPLFGGVSLSMLSSRYKILIQHLTSFRLLASGKITPVTYDQIFTLEQLSDGLGAIERRETWGKVVVQIKDERVSERTKL